MNKKLLSVLLSVLITAVPLLASCETKPSVKENLSVHEEAGNTVKTANGNYEIYSPLGHVCMTLCPSQNGSKTVYSVSLDGREWVRDSEIGVRIEETDLFVNSNVKNYTSKVSGVSHTLLGNTSSVEESFTEVAFYFETDGYTYRLEARIFDNGIAFRYVLPSNGNGERSYTADYTEYRLRKDVDIAWYGVNNQDYEAVIKDNDPNKSSDDLIDIPLTAELKNQKGFIAILEGNASTSYGGTRLLAKGDCTYKTTWRGTPQGETGNIVSAWKIINVAYNLNELVNNYNVYAVCDEPDQSIYGDTSWITTGKCTWSWGAYPSWNEVSEERMREYTLAAARLGFEYNIIDDGWPGWDNYESKLTALGKYGESLNVKQLLWGAVTAGSDGINKIPTKEVADSYFAFMKRCHMYGGKIDFWWSDSNTDTTELQQYMLKIAAEKQMIINFHGCNENTGFNVTYPNELNREAIHGTEQLGSSIGMNNREYSQWLTTQLFTRYLGGHADFTPGCEGTMQIASVIATDSPLMVISTVPETILKDEAVEFIKSIPTVWDETVVLSNSKIGESAVMAKRSTNTWYIGGIFAEKTEDEIKINLSEFLPDDGKYLAEIWQDDSGSSLVKSKSVVCKKVDSDDILTFDSKRAGKGIAIRLTKMELSSYGGEITESIKVKTASITSTVKYTLDGSDPFTSDTAKSYNIFTGIKLKESCILRVAIVSGDGKGTEFSGRYNLIE